MILHPYFAHGSRIFLLAVRDCIKLASVPSTSYLDARGSMFTVYHWERGRVSIRTGDLRIERPITAAEIAHLERTEAQERQLRRIA